MSALKISLAEWSLHRSIESGRIAHRDFPRISREEFGIAAIELVNQLMDGHGEREIEAFRKEADSHGVDVLLIMCDDEGDLSARDRQERLEAAKNHHKWVDAALTLGCRAIRINSGGESAPLDGEAVKRCAEACRALLDYARPHSLRVLVENHGGLSSDPGLLCSLVTEVDDALFGTLPDFGNFAPDVDIYAAVDQLMPRAGAVSAKCYDFDETGAESRIDFSRMLEIVRRHGYRGHLGIEYEGERLGEFEGVHRARRLLERLLEA